MSGGVSPLYKDMFFPVMSPRRASKQGRKDEETGRESIYLETCYLLCWTGEMTQTIVLGTNRLNQVNKCGP